MLVISAPTTNIKTCNRRGEFCTEGDLTNIYDQEELLELMELSAVTRRADIIQTLIETSLLLFCFTRMNGSFACHCEAPSNSLLGVFSFFTWLTRIPLISLRKINYLV